MKFRVTGERDGTEFQAPVEAESADEAVETFEESVDDSEWENLEAEEWL